MEKAYYSWEATVKFQVTFNQLDIAAGEFKRSNKIIELLWTKATIEFS